ncbi:MAG: STAS domain-containing protein [Terracidiphilus sp.]|jgi:ABC-type transporter Mla MlaB component
MVDTNLHKGATRTVVCGFAELVRGNDDLLLKELMPVVRCHHVELDIGSVKRIDAGGLSALIALYCEARKAGNSLTVSRPGRHVQEILRVVGLDEILLAQHEDERPMRQAQLIKSAA